MDNQQKNVSNGNGTQVRETDYYEILQLSPNAEAETIQRVYRIMAARYHPDNPETGDLPKFLALSEAHAVLSDVEKRAQYDAARVDKWSHPIPLFTTKDFIEGKEAEANRRLGVLCLLYARRSRYPEAPSLSLLDLEELMFYPREYLEFTLWYLRQKHFVERDQGASFCLTALGVDFVEERMPSNTVFRKLLEAPY
jgi:curved DNA-binding protein